MKMEASLHLSGSLDIRAVDPQGNVKELQSIGPESQPVPVSAGVVIVSEEYSRFTDWPGSEDLMTICDLYLKQLNDVVEDAIARRIISG